MRGGFFGDPCWPARAVAFLGSLPAVRGKVHQAFGISLGEIHDFLAPRPPRAGSCSRP